MVNSSSLHTCTRAQATIYIKTESRKASPSLARMADEAKYNCTIAARKDKITSKSKIFKFY